MSATEIVRDPRIASPDSIFEIATGFMAAKCLFVASELGLFDVLVNGPATLHGLARSLNIPFLRMRMLLNAVCALGLVERGSGGYQNSDATTQFLTNSAIVDLRPLLTFWGSMNYPLWMRFEHVLRSGQAYGRMPLSGETQRVYSEGVEAFSAIDAKALPRCYDFGSHRRLLDLGGGTGLWTESVLALNPQLTATLVELESAAKIAEDHLDGLVAEGRVTVIAGDLFRDVIPTGHDVIVIANLAHGFSASRNLDLLRRARASVSEGARLLLIDLWNPDSVTPPRLAALLACTFMVSAGEGGTYELSEAVSWVRATGWKFVEWTPLPHAASIIVCESA